MFVEWTNKERKTPGVSPRKQRASLSGDCHMWLSEVEEEDEADILALCRSSPLSHILRSHGLSLSISKFSPLQSWSDLLKAATSMSKGSEKRFGGDPGAQAGSRDCKSHPIWLSRQREVLALAARLFRFSLSLMDTGSPSLRASADTEDDSQMPDSVVTSSFKCWMLSYWCSSTYK